MSAPWRVLSTAPAGVFDGIGDFSASLTSALQPYRPTELFVRNANWHELEQVDPEDTAGVVVQYFPQAFMHGDLRALLRWLDRLRAARKPVVLMVHEYWPPLNGTLRRAAVRLLFRRLLRACIKRSSVVVTSQEWSAHEIEPLARGRRVAVIPVGSSIPRVSAAPTVAPGLRLVVFGQPAGLHRATMTAVGHWLAGQPGGVSLTWLGRSSEEMRASWCGTWALPAERVTFAGGRPSADVSAVLSASHIGLAPYENGASTRRTSFVALLEHRLPVVAVDGIYTSGWLRDSGACVWTPEGDPAAFVHGLSALVADAPRQAELAVRAGALFDARLSWARIGAAYADLLSEGVSA